ncbi:hypothetical protein A2641_00075 [Candidatus Nomurabacteria bacterium RIFCSPHIGHO2_01_FULL_37_25]|uniref:Aspartyl/glutamyl-tRNA(Asn/Gln) amidotransferase subunit C n=1 Tax=Candidatus Nomurabacteria bacterium RIFCSPLOWO2_01_FULL_36_16 TaxID=1801767 RepID=A0A1F6WYK1_9BACT|nr:MAG: hypothetical protein A2641_00075 [Candidatus Nomurabacteria bacterium RIFCSPHIGHO2_01_FULL_37_25]OGI75209.1 MAG: hypothetical protein A3D36_03750 [Candidatus Nomurabacteria bacterium RIFCSPHIGHO2_02_FULL_36_29]OGI86854.1 MAG: hypothetical protein A3A91_03205 [Candidatus Nomurabacteria bacterium RIFCSPLOWO2_01_FULL_36_16]OGI96784.1 MAG: hypothetical protein A3I84_00015 [Candidatus Nomurabacteria bacterium RIFCSPLOWO2_02_FULL_36_8]
MNIKDVENLANLARIELGEDEKKEILSDMESILEYVKQIEKVEVPARQLAGGDDTKNEHDLINVWREDKPVQRDFSRDLIISQFPDSKDGFLKVKKIL